MPHLRTIVKHINELSKIEASILSSLTMGDHGSMQWRFREVRNEGRGWAVIHYSKDGKIDGWALVFEDIYFDHCRSEGNNAVYIYVDPASRRQGIATALMRHVRIVDPAPLVVPWDDTSLNFYKTQPSVKVNSWKYGYQGRLLQEGSDVVPV